jgi:hypothetical protein
VLIQVLSSRDGSGLGEAGSYFRIVILARIDSTLVVVPDPARSHALIKLRQLEFQLDASSFPRDRVPPQSPVIVSRCQKSGSGVVAGFVC